MNQTAYTDALREYLAKGAHGIPARYHERILKAPVFEITDADATAMNNNEPDVELWRSMFHEGDFRSSTYKSGRRSTVHAPYQFMRLRRTEGPMGLEEWHAFWTDHEDCLNFLTFDPSGGWLWVRTENMIATPELVREFPQRERDRHAAACARQPGTGVAFGLVQASLLSMRRPERNCLPTNVDQDHAAVQIVADTSRFFIRFFYQCSFSDNYIVRVSPPPAECETRPIKWVESHTHYRLLPQRSIAALQRGDHKAADEELVRAAHARRGHVRRLSAARYRRMKGHTVWVRDCWVGPKEFEGAGDKKIYAVLIE